MLKILIFVIAAYFVYRIFKAQLMPKQDKSKVKGDEPQKGKETKIDKKNIEDADFEEIE
jgi:hypothetical protein